MFISEVCFYEFFIWPIFLRLYKNFSWNLLKICIAIFIWHDKRSKKKLYLSHIERNLFQLNCISIESLDYVNNYHDVILCYLFKEKKLNDPQKYMVGFFLSFCQYSHQATDQLNNETEKNKTKQNIMSCFISEEKILDLTAWKNFNHLFRQILYCQIKFFKVNMRKIMDYCFKNW